MPIQMYNVFALLSAILGHVLKVIIRALNYVKRTIAVYTKCQERFIGYCYYHDDLLFVCGF